MFCKDILNHTSKGEIKLIKNLIMKTQNLKSASRKVIAAFAIVALLTFAASAQTDTSKMKGKPSQSKMANGKMTKSKMAPGKMTKTKMSAQKGHSKMGKMSDSNMKKDTTKM